MSSTSYASLNGSSTVPLLNPNVHSNATNGQVLVVKDLPSSQEVRQELQDLQSDNGKCSKSCRENRYLGVSLLGFKVFIVGIVLCIRKDDTLKTVGLILVAFGMLTALYGMKKHDEEVKREVDLLYPRGLVPSPTTEAIAALVSPQLP